MNYRMDIIPWLVEKLDSSVKGLDWIDYKNGVFRILLMSGSKICKDWAEYVGMDVRNPDYFDLFRWKIKLKLALKMSHKVQLLATGRYYIYRILNNKAEIYGIDSLFRNLSMDE